MADRNGGVLFEKHHGHWLSNHHASADYHYFFPFYFNMIIFENFDAGFRRAGSKTCCFAKKQARRKRQKYSQIFSGQSVFLTASASIDSGKRLQE